MALQSRSVYFALGAASVWALPLVYRALVDALSSEKFSENGDKSASASTSASSPACPHDHQSESFNAKPQIMDAVNLDLRMIRKAEGVIRYRTSGITIVIERCTNDWNYSAILRTSEALGIQNVFIVDPPVVTVDPDEETEADQDERKSHGKAPPAALTKEEQENRRAHHLFAQNATAWLTITNFSSTQECIDALLAAGHTIWATDLSQEAVPLTIPDLIEAKSWPIFPNKLALVFGTEAVGVSQLFLQQAHRRVYLPLYGFADSLNLSVATALVVFAVLQMEPRYVSHMSEEERHMLRSAWFPKLAQQRLLTGSQKKRRNKLISLIEGCKKLEEKQRRYEQNGSGAADQVVFPLTSEQIEKLGKLSQLQQELQELETATKYHDGSRQAVEQWIQSPPDPLTDLRRIDQHRICFVGKNTKSYFKEAWDGLAATTTKHAGSLSEHFGSTAAMFRERARANGTSDVRET